MQDKNRKIDIIGVEMYKGAGFPGIEMGPRAVRHAGLYDALSGLGFSFRDHGNIAPACENSAFCSDICTSVCEDTKNICKGVGGRLKRLSEVNEINTKLYKKLRETLKDGGFPLVLGGDHSLAAASVTAAADHFGKIGVIWVDAHGDFNDEKSSPSGNIHGMPLSAITGNGPAEIIPFKDKSAQFVSPQNSVLFGIRSIDEGEKQRIKAAGVTVFTVEDIDRDGIHATIKKAVEVATNGAQGMYLSFDCDATDPSVAPGVSTPSAGGLSYREAHYLCEYIAANANLLGAEVVEFNPLRDQNNRTSEFVVQLITSILGKTIM